MASPSSWAATRRKHLTFMWRSYQAAGYSRLIYINTAAVHAPVLASPLEALGGDLVLHAVLLRADATTVASSPRPQ